MLTLHIDVSSATLSELTLFSQYAAASYCTNNVNSAGDAVSCSGGYCPQVQSAGAKTLYEFDEYVKINFRFSGVY
jgi:triacylglycerol lipase